MPLEKGTLIFANYTAKVKDTGEAIDTTKEEDAKAMGVYDAAKKYEPRLIAVGDGWLISGLDDEVMKMSVGDSKQVVLPPEKAFGQRDPTQTRMVPLRKFEERERELEVGEPIEVDGRIGIVRFIGSGRAQIDFNHRLAGKTITYDFQVVQKVEGDDDKAKALIQRRFGEEGSKVGFTLSGGSLVVTVPEELFLMDGLQIVKKGVSTDVFKYIPTVETLSFEEKFVNKNPAKKEEPKSEAPPATAAATAPKPRKRKKAAAATTPATS